MEKITGNKQNELLAFILILHDIIWDKTTIIFVSVTMVKNVPDQLWLTQLHCDIYPCKHHCPRWDGSLLDRNTGSHPGCSNTCDYTWTYPGDTRLCLQQSHTMYVHTQLNVQCMYTLNSTYNTYTHSTKHTMYIHNYTLNSTYNVHIHTLNSTYNVCTH
jgi:hypothetical protein